MWGVTVNAIAIIIGSILGSLAGKKLPASMSNTIMQGMSLAICLIGLQMAIATNNVLIVILSLVIGGMLGEALDIEGKFNRLGKRIENYFSAPLSSRQGTGQGTGTIARAFVTASLVYCVGAMAIVGPLESSLNHNHSVLYAKSMLDGISAIVFASTLGPGVALSSAAVFVYQGTIALLGTWAQPLLAEPLLKELSAAGGLLILGIGLNLLRVTSIKIGNLLPAVFIAPLLASIWK